MMEFIIAAFAVSAFLLALNTHENLRATTSKLNRVERDLVSTIRDFQRQIDQLETKIKK